jgi:hypothetical protein
MTMRIPVKDNVTGVITFMWEVDAEEAVRYHAARYTIQSAKPIPAKNPGGRGF